METLEREVQAGVAERNRQKATVPGRFSKNEARIKLKKFYPVSQMYVITEVRAMTSKSLIFESWEIISSVIPSAKYSFSRSALQS